MSEGNTQEKKDEAAFPAIAIERLRKRMGFFCLQQPVLLWPNSIKERPGET